MCSCYCSLRMFLWILVFYYIKYVICKHFLSICGLSFYSLNYISQGAEILSFNLSIFPITDHDFNISKKSFPNQGHKDFLFYFPSRSFIVLGFVFRPMIHFEFIFVWWEVWEFLFFFFCLWVSSCFSTI